MEQTQEIKSVDKGLSPKAQLDKLKEEIEKEIHFLNESLQTTNDEAESYRLEGNVSGLEGVLKLMDQLSDSPAKRRRDAIKLQEEALRKQLDDLNAKKKALAEEERAEREAERLERERKKAEREAAEKSNQIPMVSTEPGTSPHTQAAMVAEAQGVETETVSGHGLDTPSHDAYLDTMNDRFDPIYS